jgi:hypothetical protein
MTLVGSGSPDATPRPKGSAGRCSPRVVDVVVAAVDDGPAVVGVVDEVVEPGVDPGVVDVVAFWPELLQAAKNAATELGPAANNVRREMFIAACSRRDSEQVFVVDSLDA